MIAILHRLLSLSLLVLFLTLGLAQRSVAAEPVFDIRLLEALGSEPQIATVTAGSLDPRFDSYDFKQARKRGGAFWLQLTPRFAFRPEAMPVLLVRKGRQLRVQAFLRAHSSPLAVAIEQPVFSGQHDLILVAPDGFDPAQPLYVRVDSDGAGAENLEFWTSTLDAELARGAERSRMIALAFGALLAMALTAALIWTVLKDRLLLHYATLFGMQALYVAYISGQGFEWPLLDLAASLKSHAWNVPAAISGASACLFAREIADLKRYSPLAWRIFGFYAIAFLVTGLANFAKPLGVHVLVTTIGNLLFLTAAIFTLVVAFLAWWRGSRAAGWFLLAWTLLETLTIMTALHLLVADAQTAEGVLYYGLPLSMVAASILIALGVADRLRQQRQALSVAERHAQTDALTGVLNRRALLDRLEAACSRARTRDLPISLLFIDLDHFKQINDTFGHPAGDACLKAIIAPIQSELRQSDAIGRYGGEEFVVILSSADSAAAQPIAQRIRERVAGVQVLGFGPPITVTCSIGVASSDTLGVWDEVLIARADEAVYTAKRAGRNQVQIALPLPA